MSGAKPKPTSAHKSNATGDPASRLPACGMLPCLTGSACSPLLAFAYDAQWVRWIVWVGLVLLTVSLLVLMRTRWGQSHPLRKSVVLSLVAHLLLGIYMTTVEIVSGGAGPPGDGRPLRVAFLAGTADDAAETEPNEQSWNPFAESRAETALAAGPPAAELEPIAEPTRTRHVPLASIESVPRAAAVANSPVAAHRAAEAIDVPAALRHDAVLTPGPVHPPAASDPTSAALDDQPERTTGDTKASPLEHLSATSPPDETSTAESGATHRLGPAPVATSDPLAAGESGSGAHDATSERLTPVTLPHRTGSPNGSGDEGPAAGNGGTSIDPAPMTRVEPQAGHRPLPSIYQLRDAPDHTRAAIGHGGSRQTEAAVVAALGWLASHQNSDGRWECRRWDGGKDPAIDGHERHGAGTQADTGVSGLALLSLLASGHTHLKGEHRNSVRHGLEYLMRAQAADGNLGGGATTYEKMYCHAMASFALSEAYAMTGDDRLQPAVRRAIGYTLSAQHPSNGGWRYQPGEPGDTSQLGWQLMALKSAELAGLRMPDETRAGMVRFLNSVSSGKHGGLASYRPGHKVTRTMTAEALVCRQFLGMARGNPASTEAGDFLLDELPGRRETNLYYWYYATLGMYQLQGEHWERWNQALQTALVGTQRGDGTMAGSWDPDPVWGAYGGRVYSTALGALCLEVYYRFLPMHVEAAGRGRKPN